MLGHFNVNFGGAALQPMDSKAQVRAEADVRHTRLPARIELLETKVPPEVHGKHDAVN
jgi:hypothetical protein